MYYVAYVKWPGKNNRIPAIALLMVFLDENPIMVPAVTLTALATTPLMFES